MCHKKENLHKFQAPGIEPTQSSGSRTLFYPISIMLQIFTEDSVIL